MRAGYEPRPSSIPTEAQDPLIPIGDGHLYSIGTSWRAAGDSGLFDAENMTIDFALAYLTTEANVPAGASDNANIEDPARAIYIPYRATGFKNKTTAVLLEASIQKALLNAGEQMKISNLPHPVSNALVCSANFPNRAGLLGGPSVLGLQGLGLTTSKGGGDKFCQSCACYCHCQCLPSIVL